MFWPRRRNLWVTETLQWAPEARLAQLANPMWDSEAFLFAAVAFRTGLPSPVNDMPSGRIWTFEQPISAFFRPSRATESDEGDVQGST